MSHHDEIEAVIPKPMTFQEWGERMDRLFAECQRLAAERAGLQRQLVQIEQRHAYALNALNEMNSRKPKRAEVR